MPGTAIITLKSVVLVSHTADGYLYAMQVRETIDGVSTERQIEGTLHANRSQAFDSAHCASVKYAMGL